MMNHIYAIFLGLFLREYYVRFAIPQFSPAQHLRYLRYIPIAPHPDRIGPSPDTYGANREDTLMSYKFYSHAYIFLLYKTIRVSHHSKRPGKGKSTKAQEKSVHDA